jgi:hypothetical protein
VTAVELVAFDSEPVADHAPQPPGREHAVVAAELEVRLR